MANTDTEPRNARSGSIRSRSKKHSESEDSETVDDFVPSKQFDFRFTEEKLLATKRSKFVQLFILDVHHVELFNLHLLTYCTSDLSR